MGSNSWQEVPIGELCEGIYDGPHATPHKTEIGPVFLGISSLNVGRLNLSESAHLSEKDLKKWTRRVTPQPDDVVFSYETRLGQAAIIPEGLRCCLGRRLALIRPDKGKVDPRFLLYAYVGPEFQDTIQKMTVQGSTVDRILLTEFPKFPIRVPTLPTQRAIARILGALDDKIELNRRTNRTLEAMARAVFISWFVDFDPVRAKMEGRKPQGMDAATAALFPDRLVDSELGEIPEGWEVVSLPEAIEINPTRSLKKAEPAPYLDMANMPTNGHSPETWIERPFGSGMKFTNGDTLVARITPCLENGKTAFVDFLQEGQVAWGSTEYIVFHPKPPLPPFFAYLLARTDEFRSFAIQNMSGTSGRQRVPAECFKQYMLVVPEKGVAQRFGQFVAPLATQIKANSEQSRTLAALRDALLPKLLCGELEVETMGRSA